MKVSLYRYISIEALKQLPKSDEYKPYRPLCINGSTNEGKQFALFTLTSPQPREWTNILGKGINFLKPFLLRRVIRKMGVDIIKPEKPYLINLSVSPEKCFLFDYGYTYPLQRALQRNTNTDINIPYKYHFQGGLTEREWSKNELLGEERYIKNKKPLVDYVDREGNIVLPSGEESILIPEVVLFEPIPTSDISIPKEQPAIEWCIEQQCFGLGEEKREEILRLYKEPLEQVSSQL